MFTSVPLYNLKKLLNETFSSFQILNLLLHFLLSFSAIVNINDVKKTWGLHNVFRALILVQDWFCLDENIQVNGAQVFFDSTDITWNTATTMFTGENGKNLNKMYQVVTNISF